MRAVARRSIPIVAALALCAACAKQFGQMPPGGPPDTKPPVLVATTPDTGAVNATPPRVVFRFDEVVNERPLGVAALDRLFIVSPRDGEPQVSWKRNAITVKPRHGFRPNTVYTITMLPGLGDLRGNVRKDGASLTFSTGPTIPNTRLTGAVFDWAAGRIAPRALIEAAHMPDSVVYITYGDSTGRFTLSHLPPGDYVVRGIVDANSNRALDPREVWEEAKLRLADSSSVELLGFVHDTIGPRISAVVVRDSLTLRVTFDKPVDPAQSITAAMFGLRGSDSASVAIATAVPGTVYDRAQEARQRAISDSVRRADTSVARGVVDSAAIRRQAARDAAARARQAANAGRDSARADTLPTLVPSRPSPPIDAVLSLSAPLRAGASYRLRVVELRGLLGKARTSDKVFTLPKPVARKDSTSTKGGSATQRPSMTPPRTTPARRPPADTVRRAPPASMPPASTPPASTPPASTPPERRSR